MQEKDYHPSYFSGVYKQHVTLWCQEVATNLYTRYLLEMQEKGYHPSYFSGVYKQHVTLWCQEVGPNLYTRYLLEMQEKAETNRKEYLEDMKADGIAH
jgi:hypothetical protein